MVLSDLRAMAKHVEPGIRLALPVDYAGVSMAMTRQIMERDTNNLDLVCVPTGGLQVDQLVGAGLVRSVETSAVSLGEAGGAPRFNAAVKDGAIKLKDATCPAIHAGLMAAQKGSPFLPLRGLIGSDLLRHRDDWRVIDNPFADGGDPIVLIPAIRPDVTIFHAPMAKRTARKKSSARLTIASTRRISTELSRAPAARKSGAATIRPIS